MSTETKPTPQPEVESKASIAPKEQEQKTPESKASSSTTPKTTLHPSFPLILYITISTLLQLTLSLRDLLWPGTHLFLNDVTHMSFLSLPTEASVISLLVTKASAIILSSMHTHKLYIFALTGPFKNRFDFCETHLQSLSAFVFTDVALSFWNLYVLSLDLSSVQTNYYIIATVLLQFTSAWVIGMYLITNYFITFSNIRSIFLYPNAMVRANKVPSRILVRVTTLLSGLTLLTSLLTMYKPMYFDVDKTYGDLSLHVKHLSLLLVLTSTLKILTPLLQTSGPAQKPTTSPSYGMLKLITPLQFYTLQTLALYALLWLVRANSLGLSDGIALGKGSWYANLMMGVSFEGAVVGVYGFL